MATIPARPRPATGPELAEVLGGTFDFDNGTINLADGAGYIRCTMSGRVFFHPSPDMAAGHRLGRMSDGVGALAAEFVIAVERLRAGINP